MDGVHIKTEPVDLASRVKPENKGDFSISLRFICLSCGTKDGFENPSGSKAYKYTTTKFPQLTQHFLTYHTEKHIKYARSLSVRCLRCNLKMTLPKFREHMVATHSECVASIISVNICMLCNDHCNFREQMNTHLKEAHFIEEKDNFDSNVVSIKLCLFCGEKAKWDDPIMDNHQCTKLVNEDVAQFIDLTGDASSYAVDNCKSELKEAEPAGEAVSDNSENAPANHQGSIVEPTLVLESVVEEQPSLQPPSKHKKRPRDDSDTAVGIYFPSEDDLGRKKSYNYKCGEENCSYVHDEERKMSEHLDWHMRVLMSCETCQTTHRGEIDGQIHRSVFKKHAKNSRANMEGRVIKKKKKKQRDIVCNLEFDGATCNSYKYSSIQTMSSIFIPFVDMTYKNKIMKPIEWEEGTAKRNKGWKEPKKSHKE